MDRLFLAGLVREIAPVVGGARIRSVRLGDDVRTLVLGLNKPGAPDELVYHLAPGVPGVYTRARSGKLLRARPREAKLEKLLASASIAAVDIAALDRVVTTEIEQTRVSGRRRRLALVLEIVSAQRCLYVVDSESSRVVDVIAAGSARLEVGDRFRSVAPPPHASPPAADGRELETRIRHAGGTIDRDTLLSATGWTPMLVKEMRYLIDATGAAPGEAFDELARRLEAHEPFLYTDRTRGYAGAPSLSRRSKVVVAPIRLDGEASLEPHPMESFDRAMAEAIRTSVDAELGRVLRARLDAALGKRNKSVRTLVGKLESQRAHLPPAGALRQRGETLLAGLAVATRVDDTHVRVPDPFHPEGALVDIEIDPRRGLAENAERLFRRSRKAERTEVELGARLETLTRELDYLANARVSLDDAVTLDELESLEREWEEQKLLPPRTSAPRAPSATPKRLPPRTFTTERGSTVLVGRSARSNAELTFKIAKPDDLWLHASGIPGSHTVLKRGPGDFDDDDVLEAAGYAAYFSKARNDAGVDVIVTERRNVSSIKGAPLGLVRVKNVRTVRVRPTPPRADASADAVG